MANCFNKRNKMMYISNIHRSIRLLLITLFASASLAANSNLTIAATSDNKAAQFIQGLANSAIDILRDNSRSLEVRELEFQNLLYDGFALNLIGRFVVGGQWRKMTAEQQGDYQQLFKLWILKTYSVRLGGYSGQSFSILKVVEVGKTDRYVRTLITQPKGGESVRCDWRVRLIEGQYKIVDIVVEGVSMVLTQRQEFSAVVKRHGVDGLIETMRARVSKFPAKAG